MQKASSSMNHTFSALEISTPLQFLGYGVKIEEKEKQAWYQLRSQQAQRAFEQGQTCVERGLLEAGFFWLGRAERLAGENGHVIFSYAMVAFQLGYWSLALERFEFLKEKYRLREAVFASVMCLYHLERRRDARQALAEALSSFHLSEEFYSLATELSFLDGHGWVTLSNHGILTVCSNKHFRLSIDGKRIGEFPSGRYHLNEIITEDREWFRASQISVRVEGEHLLGSPLNVPILTWCDSLVRPTETAIEGWLWYPAEPDFAGRVFVDGHEGSREIIPQEGEVTTATTRINMPLWRPYCFSIPLESLADHGSGGVIIRDHYKRLLSGTPLDPRLGKLLARRTPYPAHLRPIAVQHRYEPIERGAFMRAAKPKCAVIIPIYRDYRTVMACLDSVLETVPPYVDIVVVDDATEEIALKEALDKLADLGRITLLRHEENRGYPASINHGLRYVGQCDVILLNSDTIVFPKWVERLQAWLNYRHVGTVTPFSNDGGICSYPSMEKKNPFPNVQQARKLDQLCQELSDKKLIDMPTANGFCMAISAACLAETGLFRDDIFSQGYGEENDFCLRARMRGFSHIIATDIYVRHVGGASFQIGKEELIGRNLEILNALHPGYHQLIDEFQRRDPLKIMRRRLDQAFLEGRKINQKKARGAILMIVHNAGGGVGRFVKERAEKLQKENYLVLMLKPTEVGCRLIFCEDEDLFPNLLFSLPTEGALLVSFLNRLKVRHVEWHHLIGHAPWVRRLHRLLDVPYDVFIHDHIWFCPRIALLGLNWRYCGEPDIKGCEACIKAKPAPAEDMSIMHLLERSKEELMTARSIIAPCEDAARRLKRHIPLEKEIEKEIEIDAWENDTHIIETPLKPRKRGRVLRVGVVGGISAWKGYHILKELGGYIQDHHLPIEIVVIGSTEDDDALLAAGIKITGEYQEKDVLSLIHMLDIDIGFIASIAPETWCYSLSWLWKAGLKVLCFDIGAVSERVKKTSRGFIVPLGMPIEQLATYLLRL